MKTRATLFTIGNTNTATILTVASTIESKFPAHLFQKVVIFNSAEAGIDAQAKIYRQHFGNECSISEILLKNSGEFPDTEYYVSEFKTRNEIFVDLTNGRKSSSVQLYYIASLLKINNIYYYNHSQQQAASHSEQYIRLMPINESDKISALSFFDLIYYLDQCNKIFDESLGDGSIFLQNARQQLETAISLYFEGNKTREVINAATQANEVLVAQLKLLIETDSKLISFCKSHSIDPQKPKDNVGFINYFFSRYAEKTEVRDSFRELISIPGYLSALRNSRNLSSHALANNYKFSTSEARTILNIALEVFSIVKSCSIFWEKLKHV